jgi:S1-C subfamily serine protease
LEREVTVNLVDFVAVLVVGLAVWAGFRSGFAVQALALAGFVGGVVLLIALAPHLAGLVESVDAPLRSLIVLAAIGTVVLLAQGVGSEVGAMLRRRMGVGLLGNVDRGAGAAFGVARGIFLIWLIGGLLAVAPIPALASEVRQSLIVRALETRLPSPVILAAEFGRIVQAAGLPDVFAELPQAPAEPVDGPNQRAAEQIAGEARASTLRVEAIGCGRFMSGTGFAVGPEHYVTNAHVVAGADRVWLSFDGALERHRALVVDFDSDLDVALLYAPGLDVVPLELADDVPDRGTQAAAIGFTGGGAQRVIPAGVRRSLEALGRDIYGRDTVAREVIEMSADVAPGDSGGPVLLNDGTVGGVTFSESRTDPEVGYALSPVAVADAIANALGDTDPVSSGACLP